MKLNLTRVVSHMFPIVGGNWNNNANAGVFYRNFNNNRSNDNTNNGCRASDYLAALKSKIGILA